MKANKKKTTNPLRTLKRRARRAATDGHPPLKHSDKEQKRMGRTKVDLSPKEGQTALPAPVHDCTNVERKKKLNVRRKKRQTVKK